MNTSKYFTEDTWRGNVFGDGIGGIQKNHNLQDFQNHVEQSFASVIEEVHLEEQICQNYTADTKKRNKKSTMLT